MGQKYLVDSNVIIDYIANRLPHKSSDFVEHIFNAGFRISVVVKIEVLGFADIPNKMKILEEFLEIATVLPLNDIVATQTISLRRQHKKLKLGDAIIAATALAHNLALVTHNIVDFRNIDGIQIIDPYSASMS